MVSSTGTVVALSFLLHLTIVECSHPIWPLGSGNHFEKCWERCYQDIDQTGEEYQRNAFKDFYRMGMEARRLKNMRSVNGTVLLLDTTLDKYHNPANNPDLTADDNGLLIWKFQQNLAIIVTFMMGVSDTHNPLTVVQFNSTNAWSCSTFTCLDGCAAQEIIWNHLEPVQMDRYSHHSGAIEPACRLGWENMHDNDCDIEYHNEMAIAILNSNVHCHTHKHDEWDDYSPCDEHFDTRYVIGTHAANYHNMQDWASLDAQPIYIEDNHYTFESANHLANCMAERCCKVQTGFATQPWDCAITKDHFGEDVSSFNNHVWCCLPTTTPATTTSQLTTTTTTITTPGDA